MMLKCEFWRKKKFLFVNRVIGVSEKMPSGKKLPVKMPPRKLPPGKLPPEIRPQENCPPEKCPPRKIAPRKIAPQENCFTRFLLLLTLSYSSSFSNFL